MFKLQNEAVKILKELKVNHAAVALKADFEAEGTGLEELVFLSRIAAKVGLKLVVKIGGCEAVFDLKQAKLFGACGVMVPVVESVFALQKFRGAIMRVFGESINDVEFILNVETKTCVENLESILKFGVQFLSGVVIGRVDLSSSLGLGRDKIDSKIVFDECLKIFRLSKRFGLRVGLGGGVSLNTHSCFLKQIDFDRFETRKVVFENEHSGGNENGFSNAITKATEFEILCLRFKRDFFQKLADEDVSRLALLQNRLRELN